jgi:hypothetical protein
MPALADPVPASPVPIERGFRAFDTVDVVDPVAAAFTILRLLQRNEWDRLQEQFLILNPLSLSKGEG